MVVGADALSALGNGLISPFLIIYLRDARGFPVEQAALVLSVVAGAGLVAAPATGPLIDRLGARRVLIGALLMAASAAAAAPAVDTPWKAFVWACVFGSAIAAMWPSAHSLMATVVEPHQRASIYSVHFALLNVGIGLGAMLGGALVDAHDPSTFTIVFLLDAMTFVVYALVLRVFVRSGTSAGDAGEVAAGGAWRRLVADRAFMRVVVLTICLAAVGYAQLESSFPAFATAAGGISTGAVGAVFGVNTFTIVALQLVVLRGLAGRRRSSAMVVVGLLWATCWTLTAVAGWVDGGVLAVAMFMTAACVFALGETFMQAALPALVNDLAPDDIRGRYNAAFSLTFSIGRVFGPALGGLFLGAGQGSLLFLLLAVACALAAAYALVLRRALPPDADRFGTDEPPAETVAVPAEGA